MLKGYCVLSVLLTPKACANGGWGATSIFMITSGFLSLIACHKLVDAGLATNLFSYPLVVQKVLGKRSRVILEICIALTQFSFAISHVTFLIESCKSTVDILFAVESKLVYYAIVVCIVYSLLSWVRNLAKFSFTFIIGNLLIVVAVIYVTAYAVTVFKE